MTIYDPSNAECFVLTFKDGLLSPVAHDLRLRVTRFTLEVGASVVATFDAASLVVDAPLKDGHDNPAALTVADKTKIEAQIRDDVLDAARYPHVVYRSRSLSPRGDGGYDLQGELSLHGVTRALPAHTELVDGRQQLELTLHQPDYGITPFRAMLGTLKIQPNVSVRVAVQVR